MTPETQNNYVEARNRAVDEFRAQKETRLSWAQTKANREVDSLSRDMDQIFLQKAKELGDNVQRIGEAKEKDADYLLRLYEAMLHSLQSRYNLILEICGGTEDGTINTQDDLRKVRDKGIAMMQNQNTDLIVLEVLKNHFRPGLSELFVKDLETRLKNSFDPEPFLKKLANKEPFQEVDWETLAGKVKNLDKMTLSEQEIVGAVLMELAPRDRMELLTHLRGDPQFPKALEDMTRGSYITVAQAETVIDEILKAAVDDEKLTPKQFAELQALKIRLGSPEIAKQQEQIEEAKRKGLKPLRERFMGQLSMDSFFTFKGVAGTLTFMNGALTALVNLPIEGPANPVFWGGIAMAGAGLELNKGFGGLVDTPRTNLAQMVTDPLRTKEVMQNYDDLAWTREVGRYPAVAELYVNYAKEIDEIYDQKRQKDLNAEVTVTLEDLNVDPKKMPEKWKSLGAEEIEKRISGWAKRFNRASAPNWETPEGQIGFIQKDCREAYKTPPFAVWGEKEKKAITLNA